MTEGIKFGTYNLKVVVQETGLKAETLRAWERRYGLPSPERSEGGHRLYSKEDIDTVKWLIDRQKEGLSISNAVDMWNSLSEQGKNPLETSERIGSTIPALANGADLATLRNAWVDACLAYNEKEAERVLSQAFALYNLEDVCLDLLGEGLAQIGNGWYSGNVSVQQEHFASGLAMRKVETLIAAAPPPTRSGRLMIAAPEDEHHEFVLLLLYLLMRRRGWDVLYLGANIPVDRLETAIEKASPRLVISSAQLLHTAANLLEMAQALMDKNIPFAFGGRIFTISKDLRERIPGHYLGDQIKKAPEVVENILISGDNDHSNKPILEDYQKARQVFLDKLPMIEAKMWNNLSGNMTYRHLTIANMNVAREIEAALALGDMELLGDKIHWVEGLLVNHNLPPELVGHFMSVYHQVAKEELGRSGEPAIKWLSQFKPVNFEQKDWQPRQAA